jgi:glycoprotein endo-alpha-1,2-mannosidase
VAPRRILGAFPSYRVGAHRCDDLAALRRFHPVAALFVLGLVSACSQASAATPVPTPEISIFYYPWYGTPRRDGGWVHWTIPATTSFASNYFPARGLYSSSDARVVQAQMREIAAAGVQEVVSSWWGWGSPEDRRLPLVIRAARAAHLAVAVHLEPYPGRTILSVQSDLGHLTALGIRRFYVYHPFDIADADWAALRDRIPGVQLFAQTALAGHAAVSRFDGIYTYDILHWGGGDFARICKAARKLRLLCLPSVGPGYEASRATGDKHVKPRRHGKTYDSMWRSAIAAKADGVTITSYNEWHEGTQIEPARATAPGNAARLSYSSYDGAYRLHGKAAQRAYLDRTAFWVRAFVRALRPKPHLPQ